jgi:hypothetical protein
VATLAECETAIGRMSEAMRGLHADKRSAIDPRTVGCRVTDLDVVFTGVLDGDGFHDMTTDASPPAQIRLELTSDDLVALSTGKLPFAPAWARGRIKVHASFGDLLRLRKFF